jgi:hypothetical protein
MTTNGVLLMEATLYSAPWVNGLLCYRILQLHSLL